MYSKDYSERLRQWNASEQYRQELEFINPLLDIQPKNNILDYGCGIGTAMKWLAEKHPTARVYGYDVNKFSGRVVDDFFIRDSYYFRFDRVLFMHSLAHIKNPQKALNSLIDNFLNPYATVTVMTPNKYWLWLKNGHKHIKTDATVVDHFTDDTLRKLFEESGYAVVSQGQYGAMIGDQAERLYLVAKKFMEI